MVRLSQGGAYLLGGTEIVEDNNEAAAVLAAKLGSAPDKKEAAHNTIAYNILTSHNTSGNDEKLEIKFDKLTRYNICRNYSDCQSKRTREIPNSVCTYELP